MNGKSIYVGSVADLAEVPETHRRLVGRAERAALADPARYFHDLARRTKRRVFRQWLKMLADCRTCWLELNTASSRSFPGFPPAAYCRFVLDNGSTPGVKLRSSKSRSTKTISSLPSVLADVYELIDGINHCGYGMAGELMEAALIAPFDKTGVWFGETNRIDPHSCIVFYGTLNGDMLGFQPPDRAVWYHHEIGELRSAGSLRALINCYFRALMQGDILERE